MRQALRALFDECDERDALGSIRDAVARDALKARLGAPIPPGDTADNLFLGLLALRVKFPREEALAKVELNISMRQARDGRGR
jgi:hypothetical protein